MKNSLRQIIPLLVSIALLSGCSAPTPEPTATPLPSPTAVPATETPTVTPSPIPPTATPIRTPPALPGTFQSGILNPLDTPAHLRSGYLPVPEKPLGSHKKHSRNRGDGNHAAWCGR